ncbi:hypothetical protein HPB50_003910 [Hyalomma asiaticum]|uniref:Uncharacterized protein n=1 Tax=Hyalomma asiaticum TaxID=266040 RepID=A0ACB7TBT7_HYAAI|nr:hypothetical protein HPB50_003910 [Hyalomma asiaticum]
MQACLKKRSQGAHVIVVAAGRGPRDRGPRKAMTGVSLAVRPRHWGTGRGHELIHAVGAGVATTAPRGIRRDCSSTARSCPSNRRRRSGSTHSCPRP